MENTAIVKEIDAAEILSLMDNSVDLLTTIEKPETQGLRKWITKRKDKKWMPKHFRPPIAEHGFSALVKVSTKSQSHSILFDTGISPQGVVTNAKRMGVELNEIEAIVLSHGHYDHFGGLAAISKTINKEIPIIVHEDMFKTRGTALPNGAIRKHQKLPSTEHVKPAKFVNTKQPYTLAENSVLITGEIPRKTDFEKGMPQHRILVNGKWQPDPWIWDDRALAVNVKGKGLIVLSGCAHAGIINTVRYAIQISGTTKVHAILGGFHLAGKEHEPRIHRTIEELKHIKPSLIAPSHCTGWKGIMAIAEALPKAFIWNSVGNLYSF
ncbi:MAG: MBL fold metallo-hydrolase [Candidatus Bathyarchaeia archaeon]